MSKETIEHYYPKSEYKAKTYEWENLFYCCDKCQPNANKMRPFQYTFKPNDLGYAFSGYFWFNAEDGTVNILENLDQDKYQKALNFLARYGINLSQEVLMARQQSYKDLIILLKEDPHRDRDLSTRYIFDAALEFVQFILKYS